MPTKINLSYIKNAVSITINQLTEHMNHSGAVLIVMDKEIIYHHCFGYADIAKKNPISMTTQFLTGSVTKQFTAAAILKALFDKYSENEISDIYSHIHSALNTTIEQYLPSEHPIWKGIMPSWTSCITLHHLLTHSSGIPNYTSLPDFENQTFSNAADLVHFFKNYELEFTPGEKFSYSNSGYYLLGFIIQRITQQNLDSYLEDTFFKPLKMNSTFLPVKGTVHDLIRTDSRFLNLARGYDYDMTRHHACLKETKRYASMETPGAAGSLISTAEDLLKWNHALYSEKIIPKFLLQLALKPYLQTERVDAYYGYGIEIIKSKVLGEYYSHRGGIPGFCSILTFIPSLNVSIISLQNISANPEKLLPEIKNIQANLSPHLSIEESNKELIKRIETTYPEIIENRKRYELGPVYESVINTVENMITS